MLKLCVGYILFSQTFTLEGTNLNIFMTVRDSNGNLVESHAPLDDEIAGRTFPHSAGGAMRHVVVDIDGTYDEFIKGLLEGSPPLTEAVGAAAFPVPYQRPYEGFTDAELMACFASVSSRFKDSDKYIDVRELICCMSLELNQRQAWAPRFRGLPSLSSTPGGESARLYLIDMQIFDLHWRYWSKAKPSGEVNGFSDLFRSESFNFEMAVKFASRELPFPAKLADARLTPSMQIEHAVLQSDELRDKWRIIRKGRIHGGKVDQWGTPQVQAILEEGTRQHPRLQRNIPAWLNVWQAAQLVGAMPQRVSYIVALMSGQPPIHRSATMHKLSTVKAYMEKGAKTWAA
jgi:hypothetical protein